MTICKHTWVEEYYGHLCTACGLFYAYGCAPWEDVDFDDDGIRDEWDDDEEEFDCGWVRGVGCQLAGTEEHDFDCPFREELERGLRLTRARQTKRAARHQDAENA